MVEATLWWLRSIFSSKVPRIWAIALRCWQIVLVVPVDVLGATHGLLAMTSSTMSSIRLRMALARSLSATSMARLSSALKLH